MISIMLGLILFAINRPNTKEIKNKLEPTLLIHTIGSGSYEV